MTKKFQPLISIFMLLIISHFAFSQITFQRKDTIQIPNADETGYGNIVAGVDFDGDGKQEIYAINSNWDDTGKELIPSAYKFEFNGTTFENVWSVDYVDIPKQNTWPAMTYGDWDNDSRMEFIWGPVNWPEAGTNPNPVRILDFEYPLDGSDNMGVDVGFGIFNPNAKWTIATTDLFELRPFRWVLHDIDSDGQKELIFCDRASSSSGYRFGIIGVSNIPNSGDGSETWTLKFSGKDNVLSTGTIYDMAVINNYLYLFHNNSNGAITTVKYSGGNFSILPTQTGIVKGGSWKSAQVVDINNDGSKEIVIAAFTSDNPKVYLLEQSGDTLKETMIADFTSIIGTGGRLYGGASGDLDGDGNIDFIFGSRGATPNAAIYWMKYKGGAINDPNNYQISMIDSGIRTKEGRYDILAIANVDNDPEMEIVYSSGIGDRVPLVVLDVKGSSDVKSDLTNIPKGFALYQNYPNPFNPSTSIKFDLPSRQNVVLNIYNSIGEKIAELVNQELQAGTHQVEFNSQNLSSGIYYYQLTAGQFSEIKKMVVVK